MELRVEYEFQFVVDGVSIDDHDVVTALAEEFDALLSWHRGTVLLSVATEGNTAVEATQKLLPDLMKAVPTLRLLHLDPDLVGVADIAERTGRSRQNVQQWVDGIRQVDTPFPRHEGVVGRSLAWRWAEVNAWLKPLGLDDDDVHPNRDEAVLIDVLLVQWRQTLDNGDFMLKFVVAGDEHARERQALVGRVTQAVASDAEFKGSLSTWPRDNPHQVTVVCAVPFDSLKFVVEQLGTERMGVLAVMSDDDEVHITPIASVKLPGTIPATDLGLSDGATVGDLLLVQRSGVAEQRKPLTIV